MNQPNFPIVACGYFDGVTITPGTKLQTVFGCTATGGGTGITEIVLNPPNDALNAAGFLMYAVLGAGSSIIPPGVGLTQLQSPTSFAVKTFINEDTSEEEPAQPIDLPFNFFIVKLPFDK